MTFSASAAQCEMIQSVSLLAQSDIELLDGCISIGHVENCNIVNFLLIKPQTFTLFLTHRAVLWGRRTEEKESL